MTVMLPGDISVSKRIFSIRCVAVVVIVVTDKIIASGRYLSAEQWFKIKPTIGRIVFRPFKFPSDFVYPETLITGSR